MQNLNTNQIMLVSGGLDEGQAPCIPPKTKPANPSESTPGVTPNEQATPPAPQPLSLNETISPDGVWALIP